MSEQKPLTKEEWAFINANRPKYTRGKYQKTGQYAIKHHWVKDLNLGKSLSQILDSTIDHIGHVLDSSTIKDFAWLMTFLMGTWAMYNFLTNGTIKAIGQTVLSFDKFVKGMMWGFPGMTLAALDLSKQLGEGLADIALSKDKDDKPILDYGILAFSMVSVFMLMNSSLNDIIGGVAGGIGAIRGLI